MLRLLVLVLLLANGLLLAAHWGVFGPTGGAAAQREPERLQRQLRPDAVQILSAQAASAAQAALAASAAPGAASAATAASAVAAVTASTLPPAPAPAAVASQALAAAPATVVASAMPATALVAKVASTAPAASAASASAKPAANSAALACLQAGPFVAADADAAQRTLQAANLPAGSWQALTSDGGGAYMVYMGRYTDPDLLQRKRNELARRKVAADDLTDTPALQPGLNLGRFETRDAADAALARFAKRGVRTARVLTLQQAQPQTVLRLPAADAALRARVAALRLPGRPDGQNGPGFVACTAAAGPASAPR